MSNENNNDESVGYGKPPKNTQFKPGQSGNPKGRPKGVKNLSTDLQEELDQKIDITEGGKSLQVTKQRAMIKTMMAKALKGDAKAANVIITLIQGFEEKADGLPDGPSISEDDQAIFDAYINKKIGYSENSKGKSNNDEGDMS